MAQAWRNVSAIRLLLAVRIALGPIGNAAGRIDPHDAVGANAQLAQPAGDAAAFADLRQKRLPLVVGPHRRAAAGRRPNRRHDRADRPGCAAWPCRPAVSVRRPRQSMSTCGANREQIDAVELDAVDFGRGRQVEHRVQIDRRLGVGPFADDARPGRIVELGEIVRMAGHALGPCLGVVLGGV